MSMYNEFSPIIPPRPEKAVPPSFLGFYERRGWLASIKKNGTNNVIYRAPNGKLTTRNRHGLPHKAWQFSGKSAEIFHILPCDGWSVWNAELLHSKTPTIKDTNYIFDLLVWNGRLLDDFGFEERASLMMSIFRSYIQEEKVDHYVINRNTMLAKNFKLNFATLWEELDNIADEGLVLKNPTARISSKTGYVKARKTTKNYSF